MFRHRLLFLAPFFLAAALAYETGISRPGGVYAEMSVASADACAQACAEDGLCMSWTYRRGGTCELKATAPAPVAQDDAISGLSSRAPADLRAAAPAMVAAAAPAPPEEPLPQPPHEPVTLVRASTPRPDPGDGLLGGREDGLTLRASLPDEHF
ncbi:MAG: PAN domain-containing protein [Hyphomonadaceae bacterium]